MTTPEIVTLIKDILVGIAAIVTPLIALTGLKNWNRELRGKAAFEVAVGLTKATYKLRDEIKSFRSPMIRADEFPDSGAGTCSGHCRYRCPRSTHRDSGRLIQTPDADLDLAP